MQVCNLLGSRVCSQILSMSGSQIIYGDTCAICRMKFSFKSNKIFCNICCSWFHNKCNSNNVILNTDQLDIWCTKCVSSIFPFNHLDEDIQFLNCVFDIKHNTSSILRSAEQFKICSEFSLTSNSSIDPDKQFYSVRNSSSASCNYYLPDEFVSHNLPAKSFSILHINARSLNKNLDHVTTLVSILKYRFTVIAISETWATDQNDNSMQIPGYALFSKPRSSRGGGASL